MSALSDCTMIIPTRNRAEDVRVTVDKLIEAGLQETTMIVVDDQSDDPDALKAAVSRLPNHRVIRQEKRTGQAQARNVGLRNATTTYCLFLDDDAHIDNGDAMLDFMQQPLDSDIAVWRFETIREYDGYRDGLPADLSAGLIPTFIGFGVLMHRERVLGVGGYRDFFCYRHEEDDLAMRIIRAGYHIRYQPGVRFIHRHSGAARDDAEYAFLSARNIFLLYALNFPLPGAPIYATLKSLSVIVKLRSHRGARCVGLLKGWAIFLKRFGERTPFSRVQLAAFKALRVDLNSRIAACTAQ